MNTANTEIKKIALVVYDQKTPTISNTGEPIPFTGRLIEEGSIETIDCLQVLKNIYVSALSGYVVELQFFREEGFPTFFRIGQFDDVAAMRKKNAEYAEKFHKLSELLKM